MGGARLNSSVLHGSLRESGWARPSYEPQLSANMKDLGKDPSACLPSRHCPLRLLWGSGPAVGRDFFFSLDILDHL